MSDTFTNNLVDEEPKYVAGMDFHHGAMDFSVQYSIPNKVDSTLKFDTEYTSSIAIAKRGKHPIIAKSIITEDIPHSEVAADWEARNDKAVTTRPAKIGVTFDISDNLLGKYASDLQKDVTVSANSILGTLKYVTDYTGFSGDPELQEGNYLAIRVVDNIDADYYTIAFAGRKDTIMDPDLTHVQRFPGPIPYVIITGYDTNGKVLDRVIFNTDQLVLEPAENI